MFPRHFELRYRVRNSLQIAKNGEASVTIAGPFHEVRSSSRARLYEPTMFFASLRCASSAKNCNSPASNAAVIFDAETPRVTGMTRDCDHVQGHADSPLRRRSTRQLRNEGRPHAAMTGPTRAGGSPYFDGGFAGEYKLAEKGTSRGEPHISGNHTAAPWMFEEAIVLEL